MRHARNLSFHSISIRAAAERPPLPPPPPCARTSDVGLRKRRALQLGHMWHSLHASDAASLRTDYHGIRVYIDVESEGGPWALVEVGRAQVEQLPSQGP